jgi:hypothetical protein
MLRSIRRTVAVAVAALSTVAALMVAGLAPAAEATPINCIVQPQPPQGACYEPVWVDGEQVTMVFPKAGVPGNVPSAKQQAFYVLAPLTDTAQGETPGFFHDHVIETSPSEGGFTPFMHGYFVICSPQGIVTGACSFNMETPPGGSTLPFTKAVTGYDLTTAEGIEAAAEDGLVLLLDTGAVFMGTVTSS